MAKHSVEQISRFYARLSRGHARYWKRQTGKMMRRLWKLFGEDAPKRPPYRGWTD